MVVTRQTPPYCRDNLSRQGADVWRAFNNEKMTDMNALTRPSIPAGWGEQNVPSQQGRIAVITGANAGLGFEAARVLSGKGAKVILACRNTAKGEEAARRLRALHPQADVVVEKLDTSDLASVRTCADRILFAYPRIDLLINNAGIMATPHEKSKDGFEMQLATNHLGHFALTGLLLPNLRDVPGSRIVAVASIAAQSGKIDFDDLMGERRYDAWKAYNQSKLANLMFGQELQRRLDRAGARTIAAIGHPGASLTNLFSTPGGGIAKKILSPLMRPFFQEADRGVLPILFAATAPEAIPGAYYGPDRFREMKGEVSYASIPRASTRLDTAERLWRVSEELTGVRYP
jgi:NAD(P)-dependent dehydrogenase (short-subunit alcohol dehydrogenase family)